MSSDTTVHMQEPSATCHSTATEVILSYVADRANELASARAEIVSLRTELQVTRTQLEECTQALKRLQGELLVKDQRIIQLEQGLRFQQQGVSTNELQAILPLGIDGILEAADTSSVTESTIDSASSDSAETVESNPEASSEAEGGVAGRDGSSTNPPPKKKRPGAGRRRAEQLPQVVIESIPEDVLRNGMENYENIGSDTATRIAYRRGQVFRVVEVRHKFVRKDGSSQQADSESDSEAQESATADFVVPSEPQPAPPVSDGSVASPQQQDDTHCEHEVLSAPEERRFTRCPFLNGAIVRYLGQQVDTASKDSSLNQPVVLQAPVPLQAIDQGFADASLIAEILTEKFLYHDPYHRQELDFTRQGFPISRTTMSGWQAQVGGSLVTLSNAMWDDMLSRRVWVATDATTTRVREPESGAVEKAYIITLVAEGDCVLYRCVPKYDGTSLAELFANYPGIILADASSVHNSLFRTDDDSDEDSGTATEAGCWFHARKPFRAALQGDDPEMGAKGLAYIKALAEQEEPIKDLQPDERLRIRQEKCKPIVDQFYQWIADNQGKRKTSVEKAFNYVLNHKRALKVFLEVGEVPITNNCSERSLRLHVRGRINWLFSGNMTSAKQSAAIASILASAVMHGFEPTFYLQELLAILPHYPAKKVLDLAPYHWLDTRDRLIHEGRLRYIDMGLFALR